MITSPLKWVGSKSKIIYDIVKHINSANIFVEPFLGSASVALNVSAEKYVLNDLNPDLVNFYNQVLLNPEKILEECKNYFNNMTKEKYLKLRDEFNTTQDSFKKAVLFLFLNKFAFNGICRYNTKGIFNVPFSNNVNVSIPNEKIKNFYNYFKNKKVVFYNTTFQNNILYDNLNINDIVYFDPPYLQAKNFDSAFSSYTKENFDYNNHIKLRDIALTLREKGVKCLISNHDTDITRELYKDANKLITISKERMIAAKKDKRKKVEEILAIYSHG